MIYAIGHLTRKVYKRLNSLKMFNGGVSDSLSSPYFQVGLALRIFFSPPFLIPNRTFIYTISSLNNVHPSLLWLAPFPISLYHYFTPYCFVRSTLFNTSSNRRNLFSLVFPLLLNFLSCSLLILSDLITSYVHTLAISFRQLSFLFLLSCVS